MAAFLDICRFLPTAGGTTDWTYAAALQGYQSPAAAGAVNGRLYKYRAESSDLTQWEIGEGVYTSSTATLARTTILFTSAGTTSKINFSAAPQVAVVALKEDLISIEEANAFSAAQQDQARANISAAKAPSAWTRTILTGGSATYNLKAGCKALLVRMVGGGGGGGGGGNSGGSGGAGGATTFGTSFLSAGGGGGGGGGGGATNGGGVATGGDINISGAAGPSGYGAGFGAATSTSATGSTGGSSVFGGAGPGGWPGNPGASGSNAAANSGSGGGGGGGNVNAATAAGGGGGAGAYLEKLIVTPAASYAYSVGPGGTAGAGNNSGGSGGTGGSGIIIIEEYY
jgi:hypothetical protein